jgi:heat shock protein HslJ
MRTLSKLVVIPFLGVLLLGACSTSSGANLEGTEWELVSINGVEPIEGTKITLRFQDGRVQGSSGCNTYSGEYTLGDDGAFQAGPIAATEMACLEPEGAMDQESNYLQVLQGGSTITRDGDALTIEGGGDVLVFQETF